MIKIYDLNLQLTAYLENAFAIGYEQPHNSLWTAAFSLPADDPKNAECQPLRYVEIFDGDERVDLFRIIPTETKRSQDGQTITYQCEHVLATLLDDVLFQYHQAGGTDFDTAYVIGYILSQQEIEHWQIGTVDFSRKFEYKWENDNLLAAAFSVPKVFVEEYQWTWDTNVIPWKLNLIAPSTDVQAYIRYGVNMVGITKQEDPQDLCTRLYGLGYGEGVNQLTFADINDGKPYIDADTQAQYGIIKRIFTDRRFESAETLLARCQAILEESKLPRITYSVDGAELYRLTQDPIDKFQSGAMVRVIDEELGIDVIVRVVNRKRPDVNGAPGEVQLEIANKPEDIASSIADLANRQRINEVYAQGATNLDSHDFADNCDPSHPAVIRFYIPAETVRINTMTLSYEVEAFRAYSKALTAYSFQALTVPLPAQETGFVIYSQIDEPYPPSPGNHYHQVPLIVGQHFHIVNIPDHTHDIEYGIFEGPTPSNLTVEVDGTVIPGLGTSETDIDIVPYLSKDEEGKIQRGAWHEIKITPDNLGRITASVIEQLFVQSRGGGNF